MTVAVESDSRKSNRGDRRRNRQREDHSTDSGIFYQRLPMGSTHSVNNLWRQDFPKFVIQLSESLQICSTQILVKSALWSALIFSMPPVKNVKSRDNEIPLKLRIPVMINYWFLLKTTYQIANAFHSCDTHLNSALFGLNENSFGI